MPSNRILPRLPAQLPRAVPVVVHLVYRIVATIGILTILVVTTPVVSWWAMAYAGRFEQPRGEVLILLSAANDDNGGISYSSYWRARQALYAWQTGGFKKIVISGGGGPGILNFLVAYGIPREAMVAEWRSRSTRQSAVAVERMVENVPGRKVLLTSDFHMYRAVRAFRKAGLQVQPMPVPDVLHATEHWQGRFSAFEIMSIESVKIIYYWVHGWL